MSVRTIQNVRIRQIENHSKGKFYVEVAMGSSAYKPFASYLEAMNYCMEQKVKCKYDELLITLTHIITTARKQDVYTSSFAA